jgi:hypothetical protein
VEVEEDGNKHSLYLMVLLYIDSFGESNVRSSVVGHSAEQTRPPKLSEFIHRYANAFCHKEVDLCSSMHVAYAYESCHNSTILII